jgi:hypothetical protein
VAAVAPTAIIRFIKNIVVSLLLLLGVASRRGGSENAAAGDGRPDRVRTESRGYLPFWILTTLI